jgi:hypothetical protein
VLRVTEVLLKMTPTEAKSLVNAYLTDAIQQQKKYGKWDLELHYVPTATKILALDPAGQAAVALALFRALPTSPTAKSRGATMMLGKLSAKLLRRSLTSSDAEFVTMVQCAAKAIYPRQASIDAGWFLVQMLARRDEAPGAKMTAALNKLAKHRGEDVNNFGRVTPESRKTCEACAKLTAVG